MAKTVSRVRASKRESNRPVPKGSQLSSRLTTDSFQNFAARVGIGTENQSSFNSYGFNPITRIRLLLDWAYRGSWLVRACVDAIPEDMTREGIEFTAGMEPDDRTKLLAALQHKWQFWDRIKEAKQWARLYGGAGIYIIIDGQKASEKLEMETVRKGGLLRLVVLDRWMLNPSLNQIVSDPSEPDAGHPQYYDVIADAPIAARARIHHSRFIRFEGLNIPYYQRLSENFWTLSVLEPLFDRITAFDSTSQGAAQLAFKAHLRTYGVKDLRQIIAAGGKALDGLAEQIALVRMFQTNEGLTLMDAEDTFQAYQYSFTGLPELITQFAQQVAGAEQIPLVRLFGQSPAGLNATGDSDWRNYTDGIKRRQESELRMPITYLLQIAARSEGVKINDDFAYEFVPLKQLDHQERAQVASQITQTVASAYEGGMVNRGDALKELKQASSYTGIWTNITDEQIEAAENEPPLSQQQGGMPGAAGGEPPDPSQAFLPGGPQQQQPSNGQEKPDEGQDSEFLPKGADKFLPGSSKAGEDEAPSIEDWRNKKKPLLHIHSNKKIAL